MKVRVVVQWIPEKAKGTVIFKSYRGENWSLYKHIVFAIISKPHPQLPNTTTLFLGHAKGSSSQFL